MRGSQIALGDVGSLGDAFGAKYEYVLVRELSPPGSPIGAGVGLPFYGESHRMIVLGGANESIASMILSGSVRQVTEEVMCKNAACNECLCVPS